jgi:hypothetical protein
MSTIAKFPAYAAGLRQMGIEGWKRALERAEDPEVGPRIPTDGVVVQDGYG